MKRVFLILSASAVLFVGGCASNENSGGVAVRDKPPAPLTLQHVLQNAARGVAIAKYSDDAVIASRNDDEAAMQKANAGLETVAPLLAAEHFVRDATRFDTRAQFEKNAARAADLKNQAAQKYRAALKTSPDFDSRDANLLNALGYFLAERGASTTDFQQAEKLTRRSMKLWDDLVTEAENSSLPGAGGMLSARRFMRANVRDSVAWAIFRQAEYSAAFKEQTAAIEEAEKTAPQISEKVPAELYYHLGEIYRAQKNFGDAKIQYQKALQVEPEHALSQSALKNLKP